MNQIYQHRRCVAEYPLPADGVKNAHFSPEGQPPPRHLPRRRHHGSQHEEQRLRELERYGVIGSASDEHFDRIVSLAASILHTPMAAISLVEADRQWFLAHQGLQVSETPREMAFCAHAIAGDGVLVVPDASTDERFRTNPLVVSEPHIRFYAGAPLQTPAGHNLGTLCLLDHQPRQPVQGRDTASRQSEEEAEEQESAVDGDVPFAERHFVASRFVPDELAGFETVNALGIGEVFQACDLVEGFNSLHAGFLERIVGLFAEQEEGAKSELMAERFVHGVDGAGGPFRAAFH
jgi:hypothetical protein